MKSRVMLKLMNMLKFNCMFSVIQILLVIIVMTMAILMEMRMKMVIIIDIWFVLVLG